MTREEAIEILEGLAVPIHAEPAFDMAIESLKAESYASERYADLCEYFDGCSDKGAGILHDRNEFKKWLERMKWHVLECDKLARQLEALKAQIDKDIDVPCNDTISRQAAIELIERMKPYHQEADDIAEMIANMPSAQTERLTDDDFETIRIHLNAYKEKLCNQQRWKEAEEYQRIIDRFMTFASAHPNLQPNCNELATDCISRQAAIDAMYKMLHDYFLADDEELDAIIATLNDLPSVQPERTCVNCGRTANNGGWYADGRTRCPIEEHYALPKDGYCHLWEKRNVTDDDYPERRTDE